MWGGTGSLPAGQRRCLACRRSGAAPSGKLGPACEHCGKPTSRSGRRYCSRACANWRGGNPKCEVCGVAFKRSYSAQRTCSRGCGVEVNARMQAARNGHLRKTWPSCRITAAFCARCGEAFVSKQSGKVACSKRCADVLRLAAKRGWLERYCECGQPTGSPHSKLCARCRAAASKGGWRERHRAKRDKAMAGGKVDRLYVFQRDGWRCHLCGKLAVQDAKVPDPLAPTIDHLVPLAAGGEHSHVNVATAHFVCNVRRSDKGAAQLALIG